MGKKKEKNDDKAVKDRRKPGKSASGKKYDLSLMRSVSGDTESSTDPPATHRPIHAPVSRSVGGCGRWVWRRTVIMEGEAVVRMRSKASATDWLAVYRNTMWISLGVRIPNAHR